MKKIIIVFLLLLAYLIYPSIVTNPRKFNLSSTELNKYIAKLDDNESEVYLKLFLYYHILHEDEKSSIIIICKGKNMGDKSMTQFWKNLKSSNKSLCNDISVDNLKDYGSIDYPWEW